MLKGGRIEIEGTEYENKQQMQCKVSVLALHKLMEAETNM